MTRPIRFVVVVATAFLSLVFAASAMAAYTPRFVVQNPSERVGGGGPITLQVNISKDDDATFRIQFFVPEGYGAELGKAPGTQMGSVTAQVNARAISPDAIVPVTGTVTAADPAPFRTNPSALGCTGGRSNFDAVLLLTVSAAGQTLNVPVYVFVITTGPLAGQYEVELAVCFGNPNIPPAQGGAALGIKIVDAAITLSGVFANPQTGGDYVWRSEWVPWGATAPNAAGIVEAQSTDTIPAQLATSARFEKKRGRVIVSGSVTENRVAVRRASVQILIGATARGTKRVATVRTNNRGRFTYSYRVPKRLLAVSDAHSRHASVYVSARTVVPDRTVACLPQTLSTQTHPCVSHIRSGFAISANRVLRVRIR